MTSEKQKKKKGENVPDASSSLSGYWEPTGGL